MQFGLLIETTKEMSEEIIVKERDEVIVRFSGDSGISSQCCLLGISRSQYYYQPSLGRQEKDFKLLVEIKKVQAEHPYYGSPIIIPTEKPEYFQSMPRLQTKREIPRPLNFL